MPDTTRPYFYQCTETETPLLDEKPSTGNMFSATKVRLDLIACRLQISRAVLIAHGRRQLKPGEAVPDLRQLRKLEAELIVRLDMLGGGE